MRQVVRTVLRGALRDIRHVRALRPGEATGTVAAVYARAERDFGVLAPPLALHSPAPAPLAASWLMLRETLLVEGAASRAAKERVAVEVSRANACPYCVQVHDAKLATLPAPGDDPALARWARAGSGAPPGASPERAAELCGVAVTFHYLNRMVHVFLPGSPVPDAAPRRVRGPVLRTVARTMEPVAGPLRAGAGLDLLPPAALPPELGWARPVEPLAQALARARAAVEQAARWLPDPVRETVHAALADGGAPPVGPSRAWLDPATARVPAQDAPLARLALLVALAPYQVTGADVAAVRARHPADRQLVEAASWASMAAAMRTARHLSGPAPATPASDGGH